MPDGSYAGFGKAYAGTLEPLEDFCHDIVCLGIRAQGIDGQIDIVRHEEPVSITTLNLCWIPFIVQEAPNRDRRDHGEQPGEVDS